MSTEADKQRLAKEARIARERARQRRVKARDSKWAGKGFNKRNKESTT